MMTKATAATNKSRKRDRRGCIYFPRCFGLALGKSSGSSDSIRMITPHLRLARVDGRGADRGRRPHCGIMDMLHHIAANCFQISASRRSLLPTVTNWAFPDDLMDDLMI